MTQNRGIFKNTGYFKGYFDVKLTSFSLLEHIKKNHQNPFRIDEVIPTYI
jgi:hypothetical protein